MNDLEVLQKSMSTPKYYVTRIERKKTYYGAALVTFLGLGILVGFGVYFYKMPEAFLPQAKVAVFGNSSGASLVIYNQDEIPITVERLIVNGHFSLRGKPMIPPGERFGISCLQLTDSAGTRFSPLIHEFRGVEISCSADGCVDWHFSGKPNSR